MSGYGVGQVVTKEALLQPEEAAERQRTWYWQALGVKRLLNKELLYVAGEYAHKCRSKKMNLKVKSPDE